MKQQQHGVWFWVQWQRVCRVTLPTGASCSAEVRDTQGMFITRRCAPCLQQRWAVCHQQSSPQSRLLPKSLLLRWVLHAARQINVWARIHELEGVKSGPMLWIDQNESWEGASRFPSLHTPSVSGALVTGCKRIQGFCKKAEWCGLAFSKQTRRLNGWSSHHLPCCLLLGQLSEPPPIQPTWLQGSPGSSTACLTFPQHCLVQSADKSRRKVGLFLSCPGAAAETRSFVAGVCAATARVDACCENALHYFQLAHRWMLTVWSESSLLLSLTHSNFQRHLRGKWRRCLQLDELIIQVLIQLYKRRSSFTVKTQASHAWDTRQTEGPAHSPVKLLFSTHTLDSAPCPYRAPFNCNSCFFCPHKYAPQNHLGSGQHSFAQGVHSAVAWACMQESGTPVLSLHPQIALLPLVGQGHPAVLCSVTLYSHSSCLQGLASAKSLALFQPHFFSVHPLILLLLHKPLCPSPLALCGSPADPGSFGCLLSISAFLFWKASGSTGSLGDLGTLSLWWGAALAGGQDPSLQDLGLVSKTLWCFASTGCACWSHCSSGNGALLCKSPCALARGSSILTFLSNANSMSPALCLWARREQPGMWLPVLIPLGPGCGLGVTLLETRAFLPITDSSTFSHAEGMDLGSCGPARHEERVVGKLHGMSTARQMHLFMSPHHFPFTPLSSHPESGGGPEMLQGPLFKLGFQEGKIGFKYDFAAVGGWLYLLQCHPVALLCKYGA